MSALLLENISHGFGDSRVVEDLTLGIEPGELVCLLGPSGCGKTTALRIAAGLEALQAGRVTMSGRPVAAAGTEVPPEDRNVGLVFQDFALFPHLTVLENVAFGLRRRAAGDRERRARAALRQVNMEGSAAVYPHTLSGGQQQRVALARALAPEPGVMLLDEPFSGLDTQLRGQVRDQTLHLLKASGAATLMVTHDPEEAMFMADRIAVMRAGRLLQVGRPEELYHAPADPFVAGLFGEINRLSGAVSGGEVSTPFGQVAAPALGDGTEVEVLIRPEALRLGPCKESRGSDRSRATVLASRLLGRTSLVHLAIGTGAGEDLHLRARMAGRFPPAENEPLEVDLDLSQTFVFPIIKSG